MLFLFIIILLAVTATLFLFAKWRDSRAGRLMDGEWIMTTSLTDPALGTLIVKGMKGRETTAKVKHRGSTYERKIEEVSGNMRNSATLVVRVERADNGVREVHCEIADWQGSTKFSLRMVTSVNMCATRIRSILADIRRADPSADLVSKPGGK